MEAPKSKPTKQQQQAALSKQDSLEKGNSHEGFVDHAGDSIDDAAAAGKGPACSCSPPVALLVPWPPYFVPATHLLPTSHLSPPSPAYLVTTNAQPFPSLFCLTPDHYPLLVPCLPPTHPPAHCLCPLLTSCPLQLVCAPVGSLPTTLLPTTATYASDRHPHAQYPVPLPLLGPRTCSPAHLFNTCTPTLPPQAPFLSMISS